MMRALWLMLLLVGCSGGDLEAPRITDAPVSVTPTESFSITVVSEPDAELTYWWSVDGEPRSEFTGPKVVQVGATEGDAWTVIVRQEKAGSQSPPASVDIPIVEERDEDTGTVDTGEPQVDCKLGEQACPADDCGAILRDGQGSSVYWFKGPDPTSNYLARCYIDEEAAWQQVMTVNANNSTFHAGADIWEQRCDARAAGSESDAQAEYTIDRFFDEGISMGACTVMVSQIQICPFMDGIAYDCYQSGEVDGPPMTLQSRWTAEAGSRDPLSTFPTLSSDMPINRATDWFYSHCADELDALGGVPVDELEWDNSSWSLNPTPPRVGFHLDDIAVDDTVVDIVVGLGLEPGEDGYSFPGAMLSGEDWMPCKASWSVRVRVID